MKAVVHQGGEKAGVEIDRPSPALRPGYVLIKVRAVALNPTDWKHQLKINLPGHVAGCDYAGLVEKTGEGYETDWRVGDRIAGMVRKCGTTQAFLKEQSGVDLADSLDGANKLQKEDGAFAEYIVAKADIQFKIPNYMSFEEASSLGVGCLTCGQGLFQALNLRMPDHPALSGEPILIYGGSTATGTLGIQYLKLAGYRPITTCSPRNFDLVRSLGAIEAYDYSDPESIEKIKEYTHNNLMTVWDTISSEASTSFCSAILASGGQYACLSRTKMDRKDVSFTMTMGYSAIGEPVDKPIFKSEDNSADFEFAKKFAIVTQKLLDESKLKPHPVLVNNSGLDGVVEGMELLRQNKVSGQKLVYSL